MMRVEHMRGASMDSENGAAQAMAAVAAAQRRRRGHHTGRLQHNSGDDKLRQDASVESFDLAFSASGSDDRIDRIRGMSMDSDDDNAQAMAVAVHRRARRGHHSGHLQRNGGDDKLRHDSSAESIELLPFASSDDRIDRIRGMSMDSDDDNAQAMAAAVHQRARRGHHSGHLQHNGGDDKFHHDANAESMELLPFASSDDRIDRIRGMSMDSDDDNAQVMAAAATVERRGGHRPRRVSTSKEDEAREEPEALTAASSSTTETGEAIAAKEDDPNGEYYTLEQLRAQSVPGLDYLNREKYMRAQDFLTAFKCEKSEFLALPKWRQAKAKRTAGLF